MSSLYIAEYSNPRYGGGNVGVAAGAPIVEQKLTISGTSAPSAAFNAETKLIRVHTDVICSIVIAAVPVAVVTNMRLAADQTEYFEVTPGMKIAVIANT